MIVTDKVRSHSTLTLEEEAASFFLTWSALHPEEAAAVALAYCDDFGYEVMMAGDEYDRDMVDVPTWLEDDYFMGKIGRSLYPCWKEDLNELFKDGQYSQAVITGSLGSGKSTFAHIAVLRMIYEASCLKDPALSYGLASGSTIAFCNLAKSKETARRVVFEGIISKLMESPYFRYEFPPLKVVKSEIVFPKGLAILAGSSTDTSIIGMNIAGGVIDEVNFFAKASAKTAVLQGASFDQWGVYTRIGRLYDSVIRRIKSRYTSKGRLPGILVLTSSKTTQDSFSERVIRKAQRENDMTVFVRDRSLIDVKRKYFSAETFKVLVGTAHYQSKILEPGEDVSKYGSDATVIDVPEDLRSQFDSNIDESLRDLAGVSTVAISQFMGQVHKVDEAIDPEFVHPFTCPLMGDPSQWDSRLPYTIHWNRLARRRDNGEWEPLINPQAKRHVHLDPASTGDAFGLAIVHVAGRRAVKRGAGESTGGDDLIEYQPIYMVDFVLRIQGTRGNEVVFRNVRKMLYQFAEHGFHFAKITTDSYQSREMIQALKDKGYEAEMMSVDVSKEPYRCLRTAIYENRFKCYDYAVLLHELKTLEEGPEKIDHPAEGGSKDLADAVCGAVWTLMSAGYEGDPLLPVKGAPAEVPEDALPTDEQFQPIKTDDSGNVIKDGKVDSAEKIATKVYVKKGPKTVAPTYKKVTADGKEEDLIGVPDAGDVFMRG